MLTYLLIIITLYLAGNAYIFIRAKQALKVKSLGVKIFLTVLFWICALSFFGTMLTRNLEMPVFISHSMYTIGTSWLIFTLYMALFLLLFDILKLFKVVYKYRFYLSLVFTLGLLGCGVYNYHHPETNVVSILTNKRYEDTPQAIKIVAISDVHLGNGTGKAALKKYVEMINAQHPDLILISGDLIDNSVVPLYTENMAEELANLKAPMGIYMVLGNHEYISGIDESIRYIKSTQIQLLRDSVVTLPNGIQLIGRDDRHNRKRHSLQELMVNIDKSKPIILLDHFLTSQTKEQLVSISNSLQSLLMHGRKVKYRLHPRYSDRELVKQIVGKENVEYPEKVSILDSISNMDTAIGLYTTVLNQAYHCGKNVIIDDVTYPSEVKKLEEFKYIMIHKKLPLLSELIKK